MNLNIFAIAKNKAEMTWRHNSDQEKVLYKLIAGLAVTLTIFIIVVAVIDIQYRNHIIDKNKKIQVMEEQMETLRDSVETLKSAIVKIATLDTKLDNLANNTFKPSDLNDDKAPSADEIPTIANSSVNSLNISDYSNHTTGESEGSGVVDSIRNLISNFQEIFDTQARTKTNKKNGKISHRGTFVFIADIIKEENGEDDDVAIVETQSVLHDKDHSIDSVNASKEIYETTTHRNTDEVQQTSEDYMYDETTFDPTTLTYDVEN